jgi:hypothetical protein
MAVAGEVLIIVPQRIRAVMSGGGCVAGYVTAQDPAPPAWPLVPVIEVKSHAFPGDVRVRREPAAGGVALPQDGL